MGYDVGETADRDDVEYYLKQGRPVILVAYQNTHWVTVVGTLGDKWVVIDPDPDAWNRKQNGCYVMNPKVLQSDYVGMAVLGRHNRVAKKRRSKRV